MINLFLSQIMLIWSCRSNSILRIALHYYHRYHDQHCDCWRLLCVCDQWCVTKIITYRYTCNNLFQSSCVLKYFTWSFNGTLWFVNATCERCNEIIQYFMTPYDYFLVCTIGFITWKMFTRNHLYFILDIAFNNLQTVKCM